MPVGFATVTGKTGPALTLTAATFSGVTALTYDYVNQIVTIYQGATATPVVVSANTTFTQTFASGVYTITVS